MPKKHAHPLDRLVELQSITVGALTASTGVVGSPRTLLQDFVGIAVKGCVGTDAGTIGDGPIIYGMMQGDMTLTELEEALEADTLRSADITQSERSRRPYQILGALGDDHRTDWHDMTKLRLPTFQEDVGFNTWIFNISDQQTTGSLVKFALEIFGRWLN